jgi:hypothetical protein
MSTTKASEKYITAIVLGAAMCFAFFATGIMSAHAEEDVNEVEIVIVKKEYSKDAEKRAEMMKQIESLRATIAERKVEMKESRTERKEERVEEKEEKKTEFKADRAEFMASLEGLGVEEKRAAMMEFIKNIRLMIEERKTEVQEKVEEKRVEISEIKADRVQDKEEFRVSIEGLSRSEKIASIMERVREIQARIMDSTNNDEVGSNEADEEVEDEEEI